MVDVKAKALVKKLAYTILEVESKTLRNTLDKEKDKALLFVLPGTFTETDTKH